MSRNDEKLDAAEYVIGTLSGAERAAFEALIAVDDTVRQDVFFWERTFGALNSSVSPVIPGQQVWQKIDVATSGTSPTDSADATSAIDAAADAIRATAAESVVPPAADAVTTEVSNENAEMSASTPSSASPRIITAAETSSALAANDNYERMRRSRTRWRWGAVAAALAALAFGVTTFNAPLRDNLMAKYLPGSVAKPAKDYIAVVNAPGQPSLIVTVNDATGKVSVRAVGLDRPAGKSLELWYLPEGEKGISVGLIGEGALTLGKAKPKDGVLLAISIEPEGGSPTDKATGPVVYTGTLIKDISAKK